MTKRLTKWRAKLKSGKILWEDTSFETCAIGERLGFPQIHHTGISMRKNLTREAYRLAIDFCGSEETKLKIIEKIESLPTILRPNHDPRLVDKFLVKTK